MNFKEGCKLVLFRSAQEPDAGSETRQ